MTRMTLKIAQRAVLAALLVSTAAAAEPAIHSQAQPLTAQNATVWIDAAQLGPNADPSGVLVSNAEGGN
jgi:hypothetical protein